MTPVPGSGQPQPGGGPGVTRFVTRAAHRLSYESSGEASGIPVLALHDLLADRGQFRALADFLSAAGFRVTLPDARGHGASAMISSRGYAVHERAADALAVLDAEAVAAAHVAAIGWGAATALALATAAPARVLSLVLAEPLLPGLPGTASDAFREAAAEADRGTTERALDLYLGQRFGVAWRDELPKPRLGAMRRAVGSLAPLLSGLAGEAIDRDALVRLEVPVRLLLRSGATASERAAAETLASLLPRARIEQAPVAVGTASASDAWMEAIADALRAAASPGGS